MGDATVDTENHRSETVEPALARVRSSVRALGQSSMAVVGLLVVGSILVVAIGAPVFAPYPPQSGTLSHSLQPPFWQQGGSTAYLLGTDEQGRDILTRIIYGLRLAIVEGVSPVLISSVIGVSLGLVAGYFGGWIDEGISRVIDTVMSIPLTLFAIAVIAVIGSSLVNLILVIGITQWVPYARTIRGQTLSIKNEEFIESQEAAGASTYWILRYGVLPNTMSSILVIATLNIAQVIIIAAGLTFLGLGVNPPRADLGLMLASGQQYMLSAWWYAVFPGVVLMVFVLGINLLGDGLRDVLDPKYFE